MIDLPRQTIFGDKVGNCYATCIAALIGVPLDDVPNFCLQQDWLNDSIRWLRERGWGVLYVYDNSSETSKLSETTSLYSSIPYIKTGKSPRGEFNHCAIYYDGELFHDPHPDDAGVEDPAQDYIVIFPLPAAEGKAGKG